MTEVACDAHVGVVSTGASQESRDCEASAVQVQVPCGRSWAAPQCSPFALLCGCERHAGPGSTGPGLWWGACVLPAHP